MCQGVNIGEQLTNREVLAKEGYGVNTAVATAAAGVVSARRLGSTPLQWAHMAVLGPPNLRQEQLRYGGQNPHIQYVTVYCRKEVLGP